MAYNRKNHLRKVIDVCALFQQYKELGLPNREIWRRYIYPVYKISERSLYSYLRTHAVYELNEILNKEPKQGSLF
jgi:hypothetical protein